MVSRSHLFILRVEPHTPGSGLYPTDQDLGLVLVLHLKVVPGGHEAEHQELVDVDARGGGVRRLLGETGVSGVISGTAPGTLLVGQTTYGATHEDVIDGVATLAGTLGCHISDNRLILMMDPGLLWSPYLETSFQLP